MKYCLNKMMNEKTIYVLILTFLFITPINSCIDHPKSNISIQEAEEDVLCYGFIVSPDIGTKLPNQSFKMIT